MLAFALARLRFKFALWACFIKSLFSLPMSLCHHTLTLAFLRPAHDDDRVSLLAARCSKHGMCHVELVFEDGNAFSIFMEFPLGLRCRTFSNPGYELVSISVSAEEYRACRQFCNAAVKNPYPFDNWGMYLASVHPGACAHRSSARVGSTFCSKIITEALQHGGVREVYGLSPSAVTPSRLYQAIMKSDRRVCHTVRPMMRGGTTLLEMEPLIMR